MAEELDINELIKNDLYRLERGIYVGFKPTQLAQKKNAIVIKGF